MDRNTYTADADRKAWEAFLAELTEVLRQLPEHCNSVLFIKGTKEDLKELTTAADEFASWFSDNNASDGTKSDPAKMALYRNLLFRSFMEGAVWCAGTMQVKELERLKKYLPPQGKPN